MLEIRTNRTVEEVATIYNKPLILLLREAANIHQETFPEAEMKINTLISVKTGRCTEDCAYCAQSSKYKTDIEPHKLLDKEEVIGLAIKAKENGATRVCLSASWREVKEDKDFEKILEMTQEIKNLGLNVCCTLGIVKDKEIIKKLKDKGISAFNHNVDTSEDFYKNIITSHKYSERLETINNLIDGGLDHCCGGIVGLGESNEDRIKMLHTISSFKKHPYSVPLNILVPIKGTPLENNKIIDVWEMVRMIATARILMPKSIICLAAGRLELNDEAQTLCFVAGANSIFFGEKLLTTKNNSIDKDKELLNKLGFTMV
ncbi:MAG: biotin synthase BioB [Bacteroidetes bacterium GWE2_29_8]|nr:MAG: biotin synthase BioB [Bacteroidetes bacterium GWE2_29_8]OFY17632.1 MAG: biotin synthase BioB [Bacteroidetes bacterium GWF2_29_10]